MISFNDNGFAVFCRYTYFRILVEWWLLCVGLSSCVVNASIKEREKIDDDDDTTNRDKGLAGGGQ